jgi:hypothetical protein
MADLSPEERTTEAVAAPPVNEALISALMAGLLPHIQQMISTSSGPVPYLPHPTENTSSATATTATRAPPIREAVRRWPRCIINNLTPVVSITASDASVNLPALQLELSAVEADTFHLDHLEDDMDNFPTYGGAEPDQVQSNPFGMRSMSPPSGSGARSTSPAAVTSAGGIPPPELSIPHAIPSSTRSHLTSGIPRRAPATPTTGRSPTRMPPYNSAPTFEPSASSGKYAEYRICIQNISTPVKLNT